MNRDFLTAPNLLSLTRVLLLIPFVAVMYSAVPHREIWALVVLLIAGLTDRYDGILARRRHEESELGRILDPLADKIGAGVGALILALQGYIPVWFLALLASRDILIVAGGMIAKRKTRKVLPSNTAGKWAMGVVFMTLCASVLRTPSPFLDIFLLASVIMLGVSFVQYVQRFLVVIRPPCEAHHGAS